MLNIDKFPGILTYVGGIVTIFGLLISSLPFVTNEKLLSRISSSGLNLDNHHLHNKSLV